jgi:hypothetical protein
MKKLILSTVFIPLSISLFCQSIIGGAGNCVVSGNPNNISYFQNPVNFNLCQVIYDETNNVWYRYDKTQTTGNKYQVDNIVASETGTGGAEIATTAEVTAGTADNKMVTPLKLSQFVSNIGLSKSFLLSNVTIVGGTPLNVSFPTNASNKDAFYVSIKDSTGQQIIADVDSVSVSGFTISVVSTISNLTLFVTYL